MNRRYLMYVLLIIVFITGCGASGSSVPKSSPDWAYSFVIWNENIYEILEDEVSSEVIGEEIGEIKQYSDFEGTYSNGFSNKYPVGTKLYTINGIEISDFIAIKLGENKYIKAKSNGKYGAKTS
ncbi:hypothetical protein [Paenibacillus chungangensis]|uniref:Uncharacterized protein n=1 Tax=Paenibacillus chungangensis TaxID=696535 RepID=A0ABW3HQ27_9BACL